MHAEFDFKDPGKKLDPAVCARLRPLLCGRWTIDSLACLYHECLSSAQLEGALNVFFLQESDLSDRELDLAMRIFRMALNNSFAEINQKLRCGQLGAAEAKVILEHLYKVSAAAKLTVPKPGGGSKTGGFTQPAFVVKKGK